MGRRVAGLIALSILASAAGYMTAAWSPSHHDEDQNSVEPGEARMVQGAGVVSLSPASEERPSRVLVYDANTTLVRDVNLSQRGQQVRLPGAGPWAILVPGQADPALLNVAGDQTMSPLATRTTSWNLAAATGGVVDRLVALEATRQPASLEVEFPDQVLRGDATVRTSNGTALDVRTDENGTRTASLHPTNLTTGTYRAQVHADRLSGQVTLEMKTFEWPLPARERGNEGPISKLGAPLAELSKSEAALIDTQGEDSVTLAVPQGGWARVAFYDDRDRVVRIVDVGHRGPDWDFGEDPPDDAVSTVDVSLPDGRYVAYARAMEEPANRVHVVLPDRDSAQPARKLPVESTHVQLHFSQVPEEHVTKTVNPPGGLVGVSVADSEGAAADRRVVVQAPDGQVFRERETVSTSHQAVEDSQTKWPERFSRGPFTLETWNDGGVGSVTVELRQYVR